MTTNIVNVPVSATCIAWKMEQIDKELTCPITLQVMTQPHFLFPCGHCFDGPAILEWLKHKSFCPLDNGFVQKTCQDIALQVLVQKYEDLKKNPRQELAEISLLERQIVQHKRTNISQRLEEINRHMKSNEAALTHYQDSGLYLLGSCENDDCPSRDKELWIYKGIGHFSINKESASTCCQCCHQPISVTALGLQKASYHLDGMTIAGKETDERSSLEGDSMKIISCLSEWKFLEVQTAQREAQKTVEDGNIKKSGKWDLPKKIFSCLFG